MEEKLIRWGLAVVVFYAIFILLWKRFWDNVDPPEPPPKIRRRHNDDE